MTQIPQFGHLRGSQGGEFVFYEDRSVRLPRDVVAMLASERAVARQGAAVALIELARGDDPALAALAREHLAKLSSADPDSRVRSVATRYLLDTQDRQLEVDIHPAPRVRPPAAPTPAAPPPESAPAYEPPRYEPDYSPGYQDSQPVPAVPRKSAKAARKRSGSRWMWLLPVAGGIGLVCVAVIAVMALLFGPPVAGSASAQTQTAAAATQPAAGDTYSAPTQAAPASEQPKAASTATSAPTQFIPPTTHSQPVATVAPPAPPTATISVIIVPTSLPMTPTTLPPPTAPPTPTVVIQ
jgi:hypothetical protein